MSPLGGVENTENSTIFANLKRHPAPPSFAEGELQLPHKIIPHEASTMDEKNSSNEVCARF